MEPYPGAVTAPGTGSSCSVGWCEAETRPLGMEDVSLPLCPGCEEPCKEALGSLWQPQCCPGLSFTNTQPVSVVCILDEGWGDGDQSSVSFSPRLAPQWRGRHQLVWNVCLQSGPGEIHRPRGAEREERWLQKKICWKIPLEPSHCVYPAGFTGAIN